ncbi:hypothetical protein IWQ62_004964 [Dispira parvispora]|uniref:Transcriptional regulatory protein n=1 Tax=Dispira parvispora TaxID=1520584 RepID=A0A9W8AKM6_9FUNG|nr:hypothetical protein IWQ62_004964 [Dispira parvispora]
MIRANTISFTSHLTFLVKSAHYACQRRGLAQRLMLEGAMPTFLTYTRMHCPAYGQHSWSPHVQQKRFAGHNKWSQIKRAKAVNDSKRGVMFTKLSLQISSAVRDQGSDPVTNVHLSTLLEEARKINMPKATVDKAVKRGRGETGDLLHYEVYQGYGPHRVALMIETMTNNPNRTVKDIRSLLNRAGGSLTTVDWLFHKKGCIRFHGASTQHTMDTLMENAIEAGAEDIEDLEDGSVQLICQFQEIRAVSDVLIHQCGYHITQAEKYYMPDNVVTLTEEQENDLTKLLDQLEDLEDVTQVHCNAQMT